MLTVILEDRRESLEVRFSLEVETKVVSRWQTPMRERRTTPGEWVSNYAAMSGRKLRELKWHAGKACARLHGANKHKRKLIELRALGLLDVRLGEGMGS
jgi:hypothetical protein